mgnify:FL=1
MMRIKSRLNISMLMLVPIIALLVVVIVIPGIWAIILSFTQYTPGNVPIFNDIQNYIQIIRDRFFKNALANNIIFVVVVVALEFIIGLGSALLLNRKFPLQKLWVSLLIAPYCISEVVACVMWRYMLDPSYGFVNYALSFLGLGPIAWFGTVTSSFIGIIIVTVWKNFPFIMIIAYSALTAMPQEVIEASKIDGANRIQTFRFVVFQLIKPALLVGLTFRIIFALREFGIIWILTEGGPAGGTEILPIYLYRQTFRYYEFGRGAATTTIMLIVTILISIPLVRRIYKGMYEKIY